MHVPCPSMQNNNPQKCTRLYYNALDLRMWVQPVSAATIAMQDPFMLFFELDNGKYYSLCMQHVIFMHSKIESVMVSPFVKSHL